MQSRSECCSIKEDELDSERQIFDDGIYTWLGALGAIFALDAENTIDRDNHCEDIESENRRGSGKLNLFWLGESEWES